MAEENNSDSSTSESEVSASSTSFNPIKALYSGKVQVPVKTAPMYENVQQYEAAQKRTEILPVGRREEVKKREEEKERKKLELEKALEEKNKRRFEKFQCEYFEVMFTLKIFQ